MSTWRKWKHEMEMSVADVNSYRSALFGPKFGLKASKVCRVSLQTKATSADFTH